MITTPALEHLVGAYLNQDWPDDYPDEWAALDDFISGSPDEARALPGEIAMVLTKYPTEDAVHAYLDELFTGYAADPDEGGFRGWLIEVSRRVQAAISA
jgi:hypothetical protein